MEYYLDVLEWRHLNVREFYEQEARWEARRRKMYYMTKKEKPQNLTPERIIWNNPKLI